MVELTWQTHDHREWSLLHDEIGCWVKRHQLQLSDCPQGSCSILWSVTSTSLVVIDWLSWWGWSCPPWHLQGRSPSLEHTAPFLVPSHEAWPWPLGYQGDSEWQMCWEALRMGCGQCLSTATLQGWQERKEDFWVGCCSSTATRNKEWTRSWRCRWNARTHL